jgi:hypothetical protein
MNLATVAWCFISILFVWAWRNNRILPASLLVLALSVVLNIISGSASSWENNLNEQPVIPYLQQLWHAYANDAPHYLYAPINLIVATQPWLAGMTMGTWKESHKASGIVSITQQIDSYSTNEVLYISDIYIGSEASNLLADALLEQQNSVWTRISFASCHLETEAVPTIVNALKSNLRITTVELELVQMEQQAVEMIAELLHKNPSLKHFYIEKGGINAPGAIAIAKALEGNSVLEGLSLTDNNIGDNGVKALMDVLKENSTLKFLGLETNNVGNAGAREILKALEQELSLEQLNLEWENDISSDMLVRIFEKL